jgi:hypothetical protein
MIPTTMMTIAVHRMKTDAVNFPNRVHIFLNALRHGVFSVGVVPERGSAGCGVISSAGLKNKFQCIY